ncbi:sesquipedalian-1-like [Lingula anatina]|uniref:Sesquipedalian-1-like n=1 Tax=Lingula anatina TaxID=7574 RepID=A0A1S3IIX5_LINAN|nr:sesquipedalian-1-like [Lingula anatina]|eukprot:XP_013398162.1 sesquipedalian-1-like [Lingula anatina]
MRLNERNLVSYATCNSPVDKEGYLMKKGEINKGFQKRWFVLKGNLLFYFEKKGDREPVGLIILEGCTVELSPEFSDTFTFGISFQGPGCRTYVLQAESQEEMESWMKAITSAGYEYMKLMVAELNRQLEELNRTPDASSLEVIPKRSSAPAVAVGSLIDFGGENSQAAASNYETASAKRFNPFNQELSPVDEFGARPFNPTSEFLSKSKDRSDSAPVAPPRKPRAVTASEFHIPMPLTSNDISRPKTDVYLKRPRTFLEMHEEFGRQIQSRIHRSMHSSATGC